MTEVIGQFWVSRDAEVLRTFTAWQESCAQVVQRAEEFARTHGDQSGASSPGRPLVMLGRTSRGDRYLTAICSEHRPEGFVPVEEVRAPGGPWWAPPVGHALRTEFDALREPELVLPGLPRTVRAHADAAGRSFAVRPVMAQGACWANLGHVLVESSEGIGRQWKEVCSSVLGKALVGNSEPTPRPVHRLGQSFSVSVGG